MRICEALRGVGKSVPRHPCPKRHRCVSIARHGSRRGNNSRVTAPEPQGTGSEAEVVTPGTGPESACPAAGMLPGGRVTPFAWIVLATAFLMLFGALGLARFGYGMVLPAMQEDLGLTNTQTGGLATANLLAYMGISVVGGALASRFGSRVVVILGLLAAALGMAMTGLAGGLTGLIVWRAVTGAASSCISVPTIGLMPRWFPERSGFAMGMATGGQSLGLVVAGLSLPRLIDALGNQGWRACWYLFAAIALVLAVVAYLFLHNRPGDRRLRPPVTPASPTPSTRLGYSRVYRSGRIWHLGLVYTAFGFSYIVYMTFFTKRLIADLGYTADAAGDLFMLMGWCSLLSGVIWGSISDRVGRKWTLAVVYLAHSIAFAVFAAWPAHTGIILSTLLFGLTAWSVPVIMGASCNDILGTRLTAAGLGFVTLFFGLGQAMGPSIAGALADAEGGFRSAFLTAAGVALLGALGAASLRPAAGRGTSRRHTPGDLPDGER